MTRELIVEIIRLFLEWNEDRLIDVANIEHGVHYVWEHTHETCNFTVEQIRTIVELFISFNGENDTIDTENIDNAVNYILECLG